MKKILLPALLVAMTWAAAGCDQSKKNTETTAANGDAVATEAAKSGYGSDTTEAGAAGQQVDSTLFTVKAASGGLMEVALGQMAAQKAASADVKAFGQRMVTDHGKANAELQSVAGTKNIMLPTTPLPKHQQHIDHLGGLSGAAFDKAYMGMMVKDHQEDVAEFEKASQGTPEGEEVKAFAQKTLPVLKQHLDLAQKTNAKVK